MNTNARQWVDALRSGKYKQGTRSLRHGDRFCCLGVACDLYAEVTELGAWELSSDGSWQFVCEDDSDPADLLLPLPVQEWLGLAEEGGAYENPWPGRDQWATLTQNNDSGASFDEIATIVENEPKGLFA